MTVSPAHSLLLPLLLHISAAVQGLLASPSPIGYDCDAWASYGLIIQIHKYTIEIHKYISAQLFKAALHHVPSLVMITICAAPQFAHFDGHLDEECEQCVHKTFKNVMTHHILLSIEL